jgi:histone H3/H4
MGRQIEGCDFRKNIIATRLSRLPIHRACRRFGQGRAAPFVKHQRVVRQCLSSSLRNYLATGFTKAGF